MGVSVGSCDWAAMVCVALAAAGALAEVELSQALNNNTDNPKAGTVTARTSVGLFIFDYLQKLFVGSA